MHTFAYGDCSIIFNSAAGHSGNYQWGSQAIVGSVGLHSFSIECLNSSYALDMSAKTVVTWLISKLSSDLHHSWVTCGRAFVVEGPLFICIWWDFSIFPTADFIICRNNFFHYFLYEMKRRDWPVIAKFGPVFNFLKWSYLSRFS